jgi:hypothetical protein
MVKYKYLSNFDYLFLQFDAFLAHCIVIAPILITKLGESSLDTISTKKQDISVEGVKFLDINNQILLNLKS